MVASSALRFYETIRHLPVEQIRARIINTVKNKKRAAFPLGYKNSLLRSIPVEPAYTVQESIQWVHFFNKAEHGMFSTEELRERRFTFLNNSKQFPSKITWKNNEFTYLWDFNLHYFEYLNALTETQNDRELGLCFIEEWVEGNDCPEQPAWHPYPTSLRIIHWVKFFLNSPDLLTPEVAYSLALQLAHIEKSLETHLGLNHYLENGRALLFGGTFFTGEIADRWTHLGLSILQEELPPQLLAQGGHCERSPMYHCIMIEGLLDTFLLLKGSTCKEAMWLKNALLQMLEWLDNITTPDGWYPLFNDAAFGIPSSPDHLLEEGTRILGYSKKRRSNLRNCDDFYVFDEAPFFVVIDGAEIGPSFNPGHAHSDNFTFELFFQGEKIVTDTGTFHYERDDLRNYERSTAAHNTVVINGYEQSDTWSSFRVGKRSNPTSALSYRSDAYLVFDGKFKNRIAPSESILHARKVIQDTQNAEPFVLVLDTIEAIGTIHAHSYLHLTELLKQEERDGKSLRIHSSGLYVSPIELPSIEVTVISSHFSPNFGLKIPSSSLVIEAKGEKSLQFGYIFTKTPLHSFGVTMSDNGKVLELELEKTSHQISFR